VSAAVAACRRLERATATRVSWFCVGRGVNCCAERCSRVTRGGILKLGHVAARAVGAASVAAVSIAPNGGLVPSRWAAVDVLGEQRAERWLGLSFVGARGEAQRDFCRVPEWMPREAGPCAGFLGASRGGSGGGTSLTGCLASGAVVDHPNPRLFGERRRS